MRAGAYTGGAPLGTDTFRFFRSFGINLKQIYGATEASALVALQGDDEADPNTVGRALPGTDVRIGELGEVQVKGPGVFLGYYKQEDATRDAITPDGWLKTGDAGLVDPRGQLAIIDRAKDVGSLPTARRSRRNSSRTSSSSAPLSARPWRSAISARLWWRWSRSTSRPSATGPSSRSLPTRASWTSARKPEVARLVVEEVAKSTPPCPKRSRVNR